MRVEKVERPAPIRRSVEVSESLVVDIVKEGGEYRVEKEDVVVSRVSGDFESVCFLVEEYRLCFNRGELEEMFEG